MQQQSGIQVPSHHSQRRGWGGAIVQLLRDCFSPVFSHSAMYVIHTHIYIDSLNIPHHVNIYIYTYKLHLYRSLHIYCPGTRHTHLHVRQSEVMIPAVVGPPRSGMSERQAGWVQGSGARKRSLDGKTNSPHYGGYTTRAVWSVDPPRK